MAEQVNLPVDVRDVFRLSCDGKAVAAPVRLILQPEEGDIPTGPLFPEQRDRGGQQLHQQAPDGHGGDAAPMEPRNGRHAEQQKQYFEHHVLQRQQKHGQALPLNAGIEPGEQVVEPKERQTEQHDAEREHGVRLCGDAVGVEKRRGEAEQSRHERRDERIGVLGQKGEHLPQPVKVALPVEHTAQRGDRLQRAARQNAQDEAKLAVHRVERHADVAHEVHQKQVHRQAGENA